MTAKDANERYVNRRRHYEYYRVTMAWMDELSVPSGTVIDVGNAGTDVILGGQFSRRIAVNLDTIREREGVELVIGDWSKVPLPVEKADLVTCCQVVEHIRDEDIRGFVDRLFEVGKRVIITVPFLWPAGTCKTHYQDPVDEAKLRRITQRVPSRQTIVRDGKWQRLLAMY